MAVFRVERTRDYTVMSNHHLKNKDLSLKAKGLLSQMLSLPEKWDYILKRRSLYCVAVRNLPPRERPFFRPDGNSTPATSLRKLRCRSLPRAVHFRWTLYPSRRARRHRPNTIPMLYAMKGG